ncbi:putative Signal transduction histidine kinase, nitrogen specific, NtrB [Nitrospina gracilis 3/211]|uniref:histidine kinase n=1 Tax=Nitrospina gracilis (strain 3/211) TaxID=1266370 RepID=M1YUD8_NITG3|nr:MULTISPECIES: ATP-binding protein [Nitrospina]MCF8722341.1 two-component system nitrogen regulation sensor histidine kinase GlnL [Nitrospina sp. Nb-3]CCQ89181.1 putative Signal transduction histidine kinase, nitrogen specific, NtrB [Nitrospina gracilis 3/211]
MGEANPVFKNIIASIVDGIILISREGTILHANLATEEMFQQSRDHFLNRPAGDLFPGQPELQNKIEDTLQNGVAYHQIEGQGHRRAHSTTFPVSITVSPYINDQNQPEGAVLYVRDCTLAQELEEISRPFDAISHLGTLSLGMAHEIKNPLVSISGSAQLLRRKLPEEHHKFLDVVIKESERINRMIDRMLNFARPLDLDLETINIHQILEEILLLEKQSHEAAIQFESVYDPSLPQIEGDGDRLKQVFLNLIQNAIEAMPDGGTLKVLTRYHTDYAVRSQVHPDRRKTILVEIVDTGLGITPENMKHLFTPFHTTKSQGNGLGLPLSLKIVENHHGKIKVISQPGSGTRVQVYLPVKQENA